MTEYWVLVVVVVPALVAVLRKLGPSVWAWVPARWQWVPAAAMVAAAAAVPLLESGADPKTVGVEALTAFLAAIGLVHTTKRLGGL